MNKLLVSAAGLILGSGLLGASAYAAPCQTSDVRITSVYQFSDTTAAATLSQITPAGFTTAAAACAGSFSGNDTSRLGSNLGYAEEGLLNGAVQTSAPKEVLFSGGAFITPDYPLQDLKGDGTANDPGWILLGKFTPGEGFATEAIGGNSGIVRSSFFSATETSAGQGTWAFTPDAAAAARAATALGNNWFDQFALVFKAGNELAVYDFTPALFGAASPLSTDPIMNWFGSYDVSKTLTNGSEAFGLSHVSLWARDPGHLPEPSTFALLGLAACALAWARRQRRGQAADA